MNVRAPFSRPLVAELESARAFLLRAIAPVADELWATRPTPAYSPVGWHLGHVAEIETRWLLPGTEPRYGSLFEPTATAKEARWQLPDPADLRAWLDEVHGLACQAVRAGRIPGIVGLPRSFLVQNVAQHELQHAEHVQVIAALFERRLHRMPPPLQVRSADRLEFPGGTVLIGSADAARAYDNERPQHELELGPYWLDPAPVTAGEFARFVDDRGYEDPRHWTQAGWEWRSKHGIDAPIGLREQHPDGPVTCLCAHEADAYARWRGARLPTEFELEAARIGPSGVWEWTSSTFAPYPGFRAYPYAGYSTPWFNTHRVLRGGSWATSPALVRPSLRNWYDASFREAPTGFRCAGGK
jgi:iron(II)-dependent oxidoreductase